MTYYVIEDIADLVRGPRCSIFNDITERHLPYESEIELEIQMQKQKQTQDIFRSPFTECVFK